MTSIYTISVLIFCTVLEQSSQELILLSSLGDGESACPAEKVIFNCTVTESRILIWSSNEYIGTGGIQLEFSTANRIGDKVTSQVNQNVFATLTNIINNGETIKLQSELHIVSNQSSVVSCLTVNTGSRRSRNLDVLSIDAPEMPRDAAAVEIPSGQELMCVLLIEWDPPKNIDSVNIASYIVRTSRAKSHASETNETSTLATFLSPCDNDLNINITAIDRCGRLGVSTANFTPSIVTVPPPTSLSTDIVIIIGVIVPVITLIITSIGMITIFGLSYSIIRKSKKSGEDTRFINKDNDNTMYAAESSLKTVAADGSEPTSSDPAEVEVKVPK